MTGSRGRLDHPFSTFSWHFVTKTTLFFYSWLAHYPEAKETYSMLNEQDYWHCSTRFQWLQALPPNYSTASYTMTPASSWPSYYPNWPYPWCPGPVNPLHHHPSVLPSPVPWMSPSSSKLACFCLNGYLPNLDVPWHFILRWVCIGAIWRPSVEGLCRSLPCLGLLSGGIGATGRALARFGSFSLLFTALLVPNIAWRLSRLFSGWLSSTYSSLSNLLNTQYFKLDYFYFWIYEQKDLNSNWFWPLEVWPVIDRATHVLCGGGISRGSKFRGMSTPAYTPATLSHLHILKHRVQKSIFVYLELNPLYWNMLWRYRC